MSPARRKISAKQVVQDIRNGMTQTDLMKKYALSFEGLFSLLNKMVDAGLLTQSEVDDRLRTGRTEKAAQGKEYGRGQPTEGAIQSDTLSKKPLSEKPDSTSPGIFGSQASSKTRKISAGLVSFLVFGGLIAYLIMPSNQKPPVIQESETIERQVMWHFSQSQPVPSSKGQLSITDVTVLKAQEGRLTKGTASQKDILPLKLEDDREKLFCISLLANVVEKTDDSPDSKESEPGVPSLFNLYVLRSYSGKLRGTTLTESDLRRGYNCPARWDDICPFTCDEYKIRVSQLREKRRREITDQKARAQDEQAREREEADRRIRKEAEKQEEELNRKAEEMARRERLLLEAVDKQDEQKVSELLSEGANAQSPNQKGLTPLMIAAKHGQSKIVELLLSKGADINFVTSEGDSPLVLAAMNNRSELVESLLEKGASPNAKDSDGRSALALAFRSGDVEKVKALLRLGANIQESEPESALLVAGRKGDVKMLESILGNGAKIREDILSNVLVEAIPQGYSETKGHVASVRFLITKGADVNKEAQPGHLPLQVALKTDQPQIFSELLAGGADPNKLVSCCTQALLKKPEFVKIFFTYGDKISKQSLSELLLEAIAQGRVQAVRILMRQGADADNELRPALLPLQIALKEDKPQIFSELLASGADPNKLVSCCTPSLLKKDEFTKLLFAHGDKLSLENQEKLLKAGLEKGLPSVATAILNLGCRGNFKSDSGQPLLILTCEKGYKDVVELLLKQGAEINDSNRNGNTALMEGSRLGNMEIVKLLLENGAKPNLKNGVSSSALALACGKGHTEVVKLLLDNGADPALRLFKNQTSLMHAVFNNRMEAAKALCTTAGIEINAVDESGHTALMYAFYKGDRGMVRLLLEHKADVNAQDEQGNTALMFASHKGNIQMMNLLLEHKADVNVKNKNGKTALGLADKAKQKEAVRILKEKGAHY